MQSYVLVLLAIIGYIRTCAASTEAGGDMDVTTIIPPSQNTMCPQNQVINDTLRQLVVKRLNQIRSRVAEGRFFSSSNVYARRASKMISLVYNCTAESSAHAWAQQCMTTDSPMSDFAEARYMFQGISATYDSALRMAIAAWRDEINTGTLPKSGLIYQTNLGIPNLSKMIWDTHQYVGCSMVTCSSFINFVCHFSPRGGLPGSQIYKPGPTCRRCASIGKPTCMAGLCV